MLKQANKREQDRKDKLNIFIKKNMKMKCVVVYINTAQIDQPIYSTLMWHVIFFLLLPV